MSDKNDVRLDVGRYVHVTTSINRLQTTCQSGYGRDYNDATWRSREKKRRREHWKYDDGRTDCGRTANDKKLLGLRRKGRVKFTGSYDGVWYSLGRNKVILCENVYLLKVLHTAECYSLLGRDDGDGGVYCIFKNTQIVYSVKRFWARLRRKKKFRKNLISYLNVYEKKKKNSRVTSFWHFFNISLFKYAYKVLLHFQNFSWNIQSFIRDYF